MEDINLLVVEGNIEKENENPNNQVFFVENHPSHKKHVTSKPENNDTVIALIA